MPHLSQVPSFLSLHQVATVLALAGGCLQFVQYLEAVAQRPSKTARDCCRRQRRTFRRAFAVGSVYTSPRALTLFRRMLRLSSTVPSCPHHVEHGFEQSFRFTSKFVNGIRNNSNDQPRIFSYPRQMFFWAGEKADVQY